MTIGFLEIGLIIVVALFLFGPDRLPEVAKTVGKWLRDAKNMSSHLKKQINEAMEEKEDSPAQEEQTSDKAEDEKQG